MCEDNAVAHQPLLYYSWGREGEKRGHSALPARCALNSTNHNLQASQLGGRKSGLPAHGVLNWGGQETPPQEGPDGYPLVFQASRNDKCPLSSPSLFSCYLSETHHKLELERMADIISPNTYVIYSNPWL